MNLLFIVCCVTLLSLACCKDYYQVLGIPRSSSAREIKAAYRRLAKKWHPDKNNAPGAHDKFLEINEAYEVLSNEDRRWKYDNGQLDQDQDPFTNFNKHFYFHFPNVQRSDSINIQYYKDRVIPASYDQPYLLYFYHDFCPSCMSIRREWDQLKSELAGLQVGMETVHTGIALRLVRLVGVTHAPSIVAVNDGRLVHFKGYITAGNLKQFLKSLLPNIVMLKDVANFNEFLHHTIVRNRPRLVVCSQRPSPSLLMLMVAKKHKQFIDFGFVDMKSATLSRHLGVHKDNSASILMFKDDEIAPVVNIKLSSSLSVADTLWQVAQENELLILPRISSPEHWTMVAAKTTRYRCVFLVVPGDAHYNGTAAQTIRQLAVSTTASSKPVRFGMMDSSKQADFINSLSGVPDSSCDPYHPLLVIQRYLYQDDRVRYAWITDWCGNAESVINKALGVSLLHSSTLAPIVDEEAPGLIGRLFDKVVTMWSDTVTFVSLLEIDALIPLLCVTTCMVLFSVLPFIGSAKSTDECLKRHLRHFNDTIYQEYIVDNTTRNCVLVVLLWGKEWNYYEEELLVSYNVVAMLYKQEGRKSVLFSVGKACHHKWYYSLLKEADLKDNNISLTGRNIVAVALYNKKKAISVTSITVSSTMEQLLGLEASDNTSLRDQMSIWLDRILDGTADKRILTNWPEL